MIQKKQIDTAHRGAAVKLPRNVTAYIRKERENMKRYIVIWKNVDEDKGTVICATNDKAKAFEMGRKNRPYGKEMIVLENDNVIWRELSA